MKLKLIIALLLLPLSAMAANTNAFDNIKVNVSITDLGTMRVIGVQTNFSTFVVTNSIDSGMRNLINGLGQATVQWGSGQLALLDNSGFSSVSWLSRSLNDSSGNAALNWTQRLLRDDQNVTALTWNNRRFQDSAGNTVWNFSNQVFSVSQTFTSNITVNGSSILNAGVFYKLVVTGTNYTASVTDNSIMFKGTTATQVTNFLPAISTTITNGFFLCVADEQQSAGSTNIVIFPNGTDTINLTTNKYLNVNGSAVDLIVDAVNKNWKIK